MLVFYTLVMRKANKMEKNKFKTYNSLHSTTFTSSQGINRDNVRNSSARSSGEVVWKRKYKVSLNSLNKNSKT